MRLKATVKVYFTKAVKSDVINVRYPPSLLTIADTSVIIFFLCLPRYFGPSMEM